MSLLLVLALQAVSTISPTSHCTGARQGEVCTQAGRAALRRQLGVKSLDDETADGVEVYRAFYLEGGGGLPAVAFVRRPGRTPAVEISGAEGRAMTADVPLETWREVQAAGRVADLATVPRDGLDGVCFDGGAVFAEVGLPAPHARIPAANRQRAASNCQDSPTLSFTRRLLSLAEPLFPGCSAIPQDAVPGDAHRFYYCFRLSGDQIAAAEVMGLAGNDPSIRDDDSQARRRIEWRRATGVTPWTRLTWAGEDVPPNPGGREAGGATDFLIARSADTPNLRFRPFKFHGVSASVVEVEGEATHSSNGPNGEYLHATYRQTWVSSPGRDWRVTIWSVDPFAALR